PLPEDPIIDSTFPFSREKLMSMSTSVRSKFLLKCSTSRIAICSYPLSEIIQFFLETSEKDGQNTVKDQIVNRGKEQRPDHARDSLRAFQERLSRPDNLLERYDTREGSVFHKRYDLV